MVNFGSYFVDQKITERHAAYKAEETRLETLNPGDPQAVKDGMKVWLAANPLWTVPLGKLADHFDHIREVAGVDHVGIGSDYDGISALPKGMEDVTGYPGAARRTHAPGLEPRRHRQGRRAQHSSGDARGREGRR